MTLGITRFSITLNNNNKLNPTLRIIMLNTVFLCSVLFKLSDVMQYVVILNLVMLNVVMTNVVMLNVVMLNVGYAECGYAECRYA